MTDRLSVVPHGMVERRQAMRTPDEVAMMQQLYALGWGTRRIAAEVGCNRECQIASKHDPHFAPNHDPSGLQSERL